MRRRFWSCCLLWDMELKLEVSGLRIAAGLTRLGGLPLQGQVQHSFREALTMIPQIALSKHSLETISISNNNQPSKETLDSTMSF